MGGDDSQNLTLWRGIDSPPRHSKPPAQLTATPYCTVTENCRGVLVGRSATHRLGHFRKADLGHFWRAPTCRFETCPRRAAQSWKLEILGLPSASACYHATLEVREWAVLLGKFETCPRRGATDLGVDSIRLPERPKLPTHLFSGSN